MKRLMKWTGGILAGLVALIMLGGVAIALNTSTPAYIKQVAAYKEGYDGLMVYVILADAMGAMTTGTGTMRLMFRDARGPWWNYSREVSPADFRRTTVGVGAFAHDVTLFLFGRIPLGDTSKIRRGSYHWDVEVCFIPKNGPTLCGKETVYW